MLVPFFVFAHAEDADIVPHDDTTEVSEESKILTEEEEVVDIGEQRIDQTEIEVRGITPEDARQIVPISGIGDGHTDHTHEVVSTVLWWQNKVWWGLFITSLILTTLLSYGVFKYLEDKPRKVVIQEKSNNKT